MQLVSKNTSVEKGQEEFQLSQKRFQLAKLLRCTEEMLVCAQKGDWESVEEMENAREKEVSACFLNRNHEEIPMIAESLRTLIQLNERISQLVTQAKDEVVYIQQALQRGGEAAQSYSAYQAYQDKLEK